MSERGEEYNDIKDSTGAWGETVHRRNEKRGCGRDTWEDPGGKREENAGPQSKWIIPLVAIRSDPFGNAQSSQGYCCHCLSCQDCFHNLFSLSCISLVLSNLENWIFTLTILNYEARWSSLPDSRWEKLYSRNQGPLELPAPMLTGTQQKALRSVSSFSSRSAFGSVDTFKPPPSRWLKILHLFFYMK